MTDIRCDTWRAAAIAIADELCDSAIWSEGMCAFHGAAAPDALGDPPRFRSMGADAYEGSAGIARFLAYAAVVTHDDRMRATAVGALRHAVHTAEGWSLFSGAMGVGVIALELAEVLALPELVGDGLRLVDSASEEAHATGGPYDFLAGTAGVIVGLAGAHRYDLDGGWRARAFDLGRQILAGAVVDGPTGPDGPPLSWPLTAGSDVRLCGFAHGASGVAMALDVLGSTAPVDAAWIAAARRARTFERAHYSIEHASWADLRTPEPGAPQHEPTFPHMWCHGSVGITVERLAASDHDALARADAAGGLAGVRAFAEQLLAGPVGPGAGDELNVSLCHGLGAIVDLFLEASSVTAEPGWTSLARDVGDLMLNDARRTAGFRSGLPNGWPTPGLMLGSAAAGWTLLRLADPPSLPSGWRLGPRLSGHPWT